MRWQHFVTLMHRELESGIVTGSLPRLILAAILGGRIGFERELRDRAAGLRTNMFIGFGAALFAVLSRGLAAEPGDHTRGLTAVLKSAPALLLVASVEMAAGGGLYLTAIFATGMVLLSLEASSVPESAVCLGPGERR
jgi:putative Mg2+ transporter-C (MgtC) family protein